MAYFNLLKTILSVFGLLLVRKEKLRMTNQQNERRSGEYQDRGDCTSNDATDLDFGLEDLPCEDVFLNCDFLEQEQLEQEQDAVKDDSMQTNNIDSEVTHFNILGGELSQNEHSSKSPASRYEELTKDRHRIFLLAYKDKNQNDLALDLFHENNDSQMTELFNTVDGFLERNSNYYSFDDISSTKRNNSNSTYEHSEVRVVTAKDKETHEENILYVNKDEYLYWKGSDLYIQPTSEDNKRGYYLKHALYGLMLRDDFDSTNQYCSQNQSFAFEKPYFLLAIISKPRSISLYSSFTLNDEERVLPVEKYSRLQTLIGNDPIAVDFSDDRVNDAGYSIHTHNYRCKQLIDHKDIAFKVPDKKRFWVTQFYVNYSSSLDQPSEPSKYNKNIINNKSSILCHPAFLSLYLQATNRNALIETTLFKGVVDAHKTVVSCWVTDQDKQKTQIQSEIDIKERIRIDISPNNLTRSCGLTSNLQTSLIDNKKNIPCYKPNDLFDLLISKNLLEEDSDHLKDEIFSWFSFLLEMMYFYAEPNYYRYVQDDSTKYSRTIDSAFVQTNYAYETNNVSVQLRNFLFLVGKPLFQLKLTFSDDPYTLSDKQQLYFVIVDSLDGQCLFAKTDMVLSHGFTILIVDENSNVLEVQLYDDACVLIEDLIFYALESDEYKNKDKFCFLKDLEILVAYYNKGIKFNYGFTPA